MDIELQFDAAALGRTASDLVRRALRRTCLPPFAGRYIDRLEVAADATVAAAGGKGSMQVPVDIHVVTEAALKAAPNAVPAGIETPERTVNIPVAVEVATREIRGTNGAGIEAILLRLTPAKPALPEGLTKLEADAFQALLDEAWPRVSQAVGTPEVDLTPLFRTLERDLPRGGSVERVGSAAVVRFGAADALVNRLAPGQEWGAFLGAATLQAMIRRPVEQRVLDRLPDPEMETSYRVEGGAPVVDVRITGSYGPVSGSVLARTVLALAPGPSLQASVTWSSEAFPDVPPLDAIVAGIAEDALDPASFGAVATGPRSFVWPRPLPSLALGAVGLTYTSLAARPDGVVIGGKILRPPIYQGPFDVTRYGFGPAVRITNCATLAKTGSGARPTEPLTIYNTTTSAEVHVSGTDVFCGKEFVDTSDGWDKYLSVLPADGGIGFKLRFHAPLSEALLLGGDCRIILRTPRGVRYVDFGRPPLPERNPDGSFRNPLDLYIDNCLHFVPRGGGRWAIGWGGGSDWTKEDFRTPPLEHPDWSSYLSASGGLVMQLLTLEGLDPGELLRFRSPSHALDATADAEGRLLLPVLLPFGQTFPALLERIDGRRLQEQVQVESASFVQMAALPGALRLARSGGPGALLLAEGRPTHLLGGFGLVGLNPQSLPLRSLDRLAALNPQPLPPEADHLAALNPRPVEGPAQLESETLRGMRGVRAAFRIPGFADRPLAIAQLAEGEGLLLDLRGAQPRVAGRISGPFGPLETLGAYAVARGATGTQVFRREELAAPASFLSSEHCAAGSSDGAALHTPHASA